MSQRFHMASMFNMHSGFRLGEVLSVAVPLGVEGRSTFWRHRHRARGLADRRRDEGRGRAEEGDGEDDLRHGV